MARTLANFLASLVLFMLLFLLVALAMPVRAQDGAADILMAEQAAPLRGLADRFVSRAMAGDASGLQSMPAAGGEPRPFTVYTVVEAGRPVVANIVPDRLVPGRHQ